MNDAIEVAMRRKKDSSLRVAINQVKVGGFAWLQALVTVNPLIYITEGFRAALTRSAHMHLYVIYPVLIGFCALFLWQGVAGFRRRVLT